MKTNRILFLDIDGPMIPAGCYFIYGMHASMKRKFSPISVGIVNELCHQAEAKIVFNTAHNSDGERVIEDAVREGIKRGHIWSGNAQTRYPNTESRLTAIEHWIQENIDQEKTRLKWVGFDDFDYKHQNLVLVDFDVGLTPVHMNRAIEILGKGVKSFIL
jgi:hypothetical protein